MKVVFAGTPVFASKTLDSLLGAGYDVACVLTQPDRPAGRKMLMQASPVKQTALRNDLHILQPATLKDVAMQAELRAIAADVMVVAAYGLILPQAVLEIPRWGALNVHASLLPRWRGAAPIQRALLAGDTETGITIMRMDAGLDTGPMLLRESIAIHESEDAGSVHDRLAVLGGKLIIKALERLEHGGLEETVQPLEGITYAHKLTKAESKLDWHESAIELSRKVRAFSPAPGAATFIDGKEVKIWRALERVGAFAPAGKEATPGEIISVTNQGISVACGKGVIELLELQRPGGKRLPVAEFLRGFALEKGACFS